MEAQTEYISKQEAFDGVFTAMRACALVQLGTMDCDGDNAIQEKDLDALKKGLRENIRRFGFQEACRYVPYVLEFPPPAGSTGKEIRIMWTKPTMSTIQADIQSTGNDEQMTSG